MSYRSLYNKFVREQMQSRYIYAELADGKIKDKRDKERGSRAFSW